MDRAERLDARGSDSHPGGVKETFGYLTPWPLTDRSQQTHSGGAHLHAEEKRVDEGRRGRRKKSLQAGNHAKGKVGLEEVEKNQLSRGKKTHYQFVFFLCWRRASLFFSLK